MDYSVSQTTLEQVRQMIVQQNITLCYSVGIPQLC